MAAQAQNGTDASDLTSAAMWGDKELLESLLKNGADPNFPNHQGNSALHEAAYYGELECASILLDYKANVNIVGGGGYTPLHKAVTGVAMLEPGNKFDSEEHIKVNQCDFINLLVAHGAQLNAKDNTGSTPMELANDNDFYEGVDLLKELEVIIDKETKKREKEQRLKDLYDACQSGDLERVREHLLNMPEAINEFIKDGKNLLMCASDNGYLELVLYLLDNRAIAVSSPVSHHTALHLACRRGHTDIAIALLNRLPALLAIDDSPGETSLHIAAREGQVEIVRNLLAIAARAKQLKSMERSNSGSGRSDVSLYGSGNERVQQNLEHLDSLGEVTVDIMAPSVSDKRTPLHEASMAGHVEVVKLIINFMREFYTRSSGGKRVSNLSSRIDCEGGVVSTPSRGDGNSPLMSSRSVTGSNTSPTKRPKPVPGVDQMTLRGRTAFHEAAKASHFEVMRTLLKAGADINAYMRPSLDTTINVELTALVQACLMNRVDIVRFLLQNGATDARLKALTRSLRQSFDGVAGVLMSYNGGVHVVPNENHLTKPNNNQESDKTRLAPISVEWNSKKLKYIRESWFHAVLKEVSVPGNRTPVISHIDISSNELTELPVALFQLKHLTRLEVSRNKLTSLPVSPDDRARQGWDCPKLAELDISSNALTSLPSYLFQLAELKELNANDNEILDVDISVWTAPKLSKLFLSRNKLTIFPSTGTVEGVATSTQTDGAYRESGYQTGAVTSVPMSSGQHGAKSLNDSQNQFDESVNAWGHRRKSTGLSSMLTSTNGARRGATFGRDPRRMSIGSMQSSVISWRFKNFQDTNFDVDELEDIEGDTNDDGSEGFTLEHLDLSRNMLTSVPSGLSCLAPKLQKLIISHNQIHSLGHLNDYPPNLELFDASNNQLCSAITEPAIQTVYVPCTRKALFSNLAASLMESVSSPTSAAYKSCSHRLHKNLQKLSTIRLARNQLVDVQLFRMVSRCRTSDLTSSIEESTVPNKQRTVSNDPFAVRVIQGQSGRKELSKSMSAPYSRDVSQPSPTVGTKRGVIKAESGDGVRGDGVRNARGGGGHSSNSSNSGGSQDNNGSGSGLQSPSSTIISPLFPMLSTLELAHNKLHNLPNNIHLVSTLACLVLSHNPIESLPLELSNLEHLWNLEYEGCNLTFPPKEDLDKYRLAADKLLYMRSLLHDAKPNESLKLMLVGLQKMGKTTLLSRLREVNEAQMIASTFNERVKGVEKITSARHTGLGSRVRKKGEVLSTVGVDLGIWRYRKDLEPGKKRAGGKEAMKSVTFYTWDFGGQEEYYVTHQCFLSTRSLYLVVWDVEKGEEGIDQLGPWLHNIQARAPGSPVIIVGTHIDRLKGEDRDKRKIELSNLIKDKYLVGRGPQQQRELGLPKIRDVMYVGCPNSGRDEGIAELRKALYDIAFTLTLPKAGHSSGSKMKLLEQPIPASFLQLEERVRILATNLKQDAEPPLLKENRFREETNDIIANPRELDQAVTFLHENGVMLHYSTPALSHLYFVDPQWLCDMLAHVVTVPEVNSFIPRSDGPDAGILRTSVLAHVFKGKHFPQEHRQEYIELLGKFEVALILDRHRLLVPSLLPLCPRYTIHAFRNVFPRPTIKQVLDRYPNVSKLFSTPKSQGGIVNISSTSPHSPCSLASTPTKAGNTALNAASHISEELFRTGLLLRRFYFMTYVPSGFWPRLISRFLTCTTFVRIVLRALGYTEEEIKDKVGEVATGEMNKALGLEWAYWKTGIELWYKGLSLLRVTEILSDDIFDNCEPSPSIFEQSHTIPIKPFEAVQDLSFELNKQWMPVHMTPNHGIEILVPDTVCPAVLKSELDEDREREGGCGSDGERERLWMSAGLLTQAVDFIDTLLEDWYPGLGAREGNTTVESIPYVNRVIPCPFCVSGACVSDPGYRETAREPTPPSSVDSIRGQSPSSSSSSRPHKDKVYSPGSAPTDPPSFSHQSSHNEVIAQPHRSRAVNISNSPPLTANVHQVTRRPLFLQDSSHPSTKSPSTSPQGSSPLDIPHYSPQIEHRVTSDLRLSQQRRTRSLSSPISSPARLPMFPTPPLIHRVNKSQEDVKKCVNLEPLAQPLYDEEKGLVLASKFGFMIESCIMAVRSSEDMICPAHKTHPLPVRDIAPDVVFADLPSQFLLNSNCVDKGVYVDHGTFGDIYRGTVYPTPTSTDDEGREVALKIDRLDSKKCTPETATKSYIEVRAEVSLLHKLRHTHVIDFIGVILQPLCFILEWACNGSLHSILAKYRKADARIGPLVLQQTTLQVAAGLSYLHQHKVVYYDLKSPNVLVFQFPTPQQSMLQPSHQLSCEGSSVYVKIADLGISRIMSPGGTMGFKGSPGFMAPEILKYVGMEAVTEKVDIYSFGMFMYELVSLYFPFEKQNLMSSQIEKLVIDGERPPLQNRELSNPILYLDVMRWCWQQDFRSRPSANQLIEVLSSDSVPSLMEAISLHGTTDITCDALCIVPIEQSAPEDQEFNSLSMTSLPTSHQYVARGDLQEDVWLGLYSTKGKGGGGVGEREEGESQVCVINFRGKTSFTTQSFPVSSGRITCMCCVVDTMWVGTEEGELFIFDSLTKNEILSRILALLPGQSISNITHIPTFRQVLVTRSDGCVLLFDEVTQEHKLPDDSRYDNRLNGTQLPVRSVFRAPEKLPIFRALVVRGQSEDERTVWCGSSFEMILLIDINNTGLGFCRKCHCRPRNDITARDHVIDLTLMERPGEEREMERIVWTLTQPHNHVYCWSTVTERLLMTVDCSIYSPSPVTCICSVHDRLHLAQSSGQILQLHTPHNNIHSATKLHGHVKSIHSLFTLGARTLPRHWRPSILGRSNVMDYLLELLGDEDIQDINDSMIGTQSRLLVSIGSGFYGIAGKVVEALMSPSDISDNFLLLWSL